MGFSQHCSILPCNRLKLFFPDLQISVSGVGSPPSLRSLLCLFAKGEDFETQAEEQYVAKYGEHGVGKNVHCTIARKSILRRILPPSLAVQEQERRPSVALLAERGGPLPGPAPATGAQADEAGGGEGAPLGVQQQAQVPLLPPRHAPLLARKQAHPGEVPGGRDWPSGWGRQCSKRVLGVPRQGFTEDPPGIDTQEDREAEAEAKAEEGEEDAEEEGRARQEGYAMRRGVNVKLYYFYQKLKT